MPGQGAGAGKRCAAATTEPFLSDQTSVTQSRGRPTITPTTIHTPATAMAARIWCLPPAPVTGEVISASDAQCNFVPGLPNYFVDTKIIPIYVLFRKTQFLLPFSKPESLASTPRHTRPCHCILHTILILSPLSPSLPLSSHLLSSLLAPPSFLLTPPTPPTLEMVRTCLLTS